jgi:hypothetical protein
LIEIAIEVSLGIDRRKGWRREHGKAVDLGSCLIEMTIGGARGEAIERGPRGE